MNTKSLPERLALIEGYDVDLAMRSAGGQVPVLVRILRRFVTTYRYGLPALLHATGAEHELVNRWRLVCHSALGALSAIGATTAARATADLERELRDLGSRATFIAKGRAVHELVTALATRLAIELVSTESRPVAQVAARSPGRTDPRRLAALGRLAVLDTAPEADYDAVTLQLAEALGVPIAIVNLLDDDRDWFKSRVGLESAQSSVAGSFCESFFDTQSDFIAIEDTMADSRFSSHPFVTGTPFIRFYAATRLAFDGHLVGTLCAYDTRPKRIASEDLTQIKRLGDAVTRLLAARETALAA